MWHFSHAVVTCGFSRERSPISVESDQRFHPRRLPSESPNSRTTSENSSGKPGIPPVDALRKTSRVSEAKFVPAGPPLASRKHRQFSTNRRARRLWISPSCRTEDKSTISEATLAFGFSADARILLAIPRLNPNSWHCESLPSTPVSSQNQRLSIGAQQRKSPRGEWSSGKGAAAPNEKGGSTLCLTRTCHRRD